MDEREIDAILGDNNWLSWLPIRHFLPAPLLRGLIRKILATAGESLENHFSELLLGDVASAQTWLLNPTHLAVDANDYWQRFIRRLISAGYQPSPLSEAGHDNVDLRLIDFAMSLDGLPLSTSVNAPDYLEACSQPSFLRLIEIRSLISTRFFADSAEDLCETSATILNEPSPLNVVTLKYFGDLLLVEGNASAANLLYSQSLSMLSSVMQSINCEPLGEWRDIIYQSKANAALEVSDESKEIDNFIQNINYADIKSHSIALLNGSLDAYIFSRKTDPFAADKRTAIYLPPLIKTSHDATQALTLRFKKDYEGASRAFYSLQRRQLALGLHYESRRTFGLWGQTLIEALSNDSKNFGTSSFDAAVNFLLSSGDAKFVIDLPWSELLVDNYIDEDRAEKIAGLFSSNCAVAQRLLIAVTLIESWLRVIRSDSPACKYLLLGLIAAMRSSVEAKDKSALREHGAKALERITKSRHDLPYSEAGIGAAICSTILDGGLYEVISTLELTKNIISRLSHADKLGIVNSIITLVDRPNSKRVGWPVLRPAMNILSSDEVIEALDKFGKNRTEVLDIIVRIGAGSEGENASLLYQIRNLKDNLSPVHFEKIESVIAIVRANAQNPNRSNATFNIHALLASPEIVGREGVNDALKGLKLILKSGYSERASPSFPKAYEVLSHLRGDGEKIAAALHISWSEFVDELRWIFEEISKIWSAAIDFPQLFADFSFLPSSMPNDIIVHNWALETISFGSLFVAAEIIRSDLEKVAKGQPKLSAGIQLAFATLATDFSSFTSPVEIIEAESRDEFYSKLSRRLITIVKNNDSALWQAVFDRCLTLGPRAEDAAVFVCSKHEWLANRSAKIDSYAQRVASNASLRILLMPLIVDLSSRRV